MRTHLLDMPVLRASMSGGCLGTIRATDYHIDLYEGTRPIRSVPYRQGLARRAIFEAEIKRQFAAEAIEPTTSVCRCPSLKEGRDVSLLCGLPEAQHADAPGRVSNSSYGKFYRIV